MKSGAAGSNIFKSKLNNNDNYLSLPIFSMDNFLENFKIDFPDYVKIDVDGYENYVLDGMESILSNKRLKSLLVEIYIGDKKHYNSVIEKLIKHDFELVYKSSGLHSNHIFDRL